MRAWVLYAVAAVVLLTGLAGTVSLLVGAERAPGAWLAAGVAAVVQLAAFAGLVWSRRSHGFLVAWAGGMTLRFAVIAGAAFWVTRRTSLDAPVTLLSLVGFVFVLVLLEPAFLRLEGGTGSVEKPESPRGTTDD